MIFDSSVSAALLEPWSLEAKGISLQSCTEAGTIIVVRCDGFEGCGHLLG